MTGTEAVIPVIDCSAIGLNVKTEDIKEGDTVIIGEQMKKAFATVGFCYLKNHGVDESIIERCFDESLKFFTLPTTEKEKLQMQKGRNFGWVGSEKEKLTAERPPDLKEAFNYCPQDEKSGDDWPNGGFEKSVKKMFDAGTILAIRLLDCLSFVLGQEKSFMAKAHTAIGKMGSTTTLRTLYYPPISDSSSIKPGQIRLAEHSDYGTMTLLFQDDVGGLEDKIPGKGYVPVTPIPGTILINLGDLMQRWTADTLLATKHRVCIPEEEIRRKKARQSIAVFIVPNDDYEIKPIDGSKTYEPTTSRKYIDEKMSAAIWKY